MGRIFSTNQTKRECDIMIREPISEIGKKILKISIVDMLLTVWIIPLAQTSYGLTFVQAAGIAAVVIALISYFISVRFKNFY